jgi:hypothetical protein
LCEWQPPVKVQIVGSEDRPSSAWHHYTSYTQIGRTSTETVQSILPSGEP